MSSAPRGSQLPPQPAPCSAVRRRPSPPPANAAVATAAVTPAPPTAALSTVTIGPLRVTNSFVSAVGWVKPGETYPSRISSPTPALPTPRHRSRSWRRRGRPSSRQRANRDPRRDRPQLVWTGRSPANDSLMLVLESQADTTSVEPTVVWRDLSTTATVTVGGDSEALTSHGPKVIPPGAAYDTARYGDRPFPVVPVQYTDRAYVAEHDGDELDAVINDPANAGLDVQPLPGDDARPALPRRHRPLDRHRHRRLRLRANGSTSAAPRQFTRSPTHWVAAPAPGVTVRRQPRSRPRAPRSTPSGSPTASTTCPAPPSYYGARRQRLRARRLARRRRRAAADRQRLRPDRQDRRTTPRPSPTRRSTTPTTTPTRTASSTSSWPSSPGAAATAPRS